MLQSKFQLHGSAGTVRDFTVSNIRIFKTSALRVNPVQGRGIFSCYNLQLLNLILQLSLSYLRLALILFYFDFACYFLLILRRVDRVFQGQHLPSLSTNYVTIIYVNQDFKKKTTKAVLDKDENL